MKCVMKLGMWRSARTADRSSGDPGRGVRLFCFGLAVATPLAGTAQVPDMVQHTLDSLIRAQATRLVRVVGAREVTIDSVTHTASVRLYNPSSDTTVVHLSLQFAPFNNVQLTSADALLAEDSAKTDSVLRDSVRTEALRKRWSLESWVQEPLPVDIWLAPHQTVALTLHVKIPPALPPGNYSAHLIVNTLAIVAGPAMNIPLPAISLGNGLQTAAGTLNLPGIRTLTVLPPAIAPRASVKLVYRAVGPIPQ